MVKLQIDRRISICSRYLTVASRINFLGQIARSVEQWNKKRFLQGLHRSPCSTGIFQWKLLCQLVVLRRIFASNDSEVWILFPITSMLSFSPQNPCANNPCLNNGICQVGFTTKGYRCVCVPGSAGANCAGIVKFYFQSSFPWSWIFKKQIWLSKQK